MTTYQALIVGAGEMGRAWGRALHECDAVTIGGWVDIRPGSAATAAADLGLADLCCLVLSAKL